MSEPGNNDDDVDLLVRAADILRLQWDDLFPDFNPTPAYAWSEALSRANGGSIPPECWKHLRGQSRREVGPMLGADWWNQLGEPRPGRPHPDQRSEAWGVWEPLVPYADDRDVIAAALERTAQAIATVRVPRRDVRDLSSTSLDVPTLLVAAMSILDSGAMIRDGQLPDPADAFRRALRAANGGSEKGAFPLALAQVEACQCAQAARALLTSSPRVFRPHAVAQPFGDSLDAQWLFEPYTEALEEAVVRAPSSPSAFQILVDATRLLRRDGGESATWADYRPEAIFLAIEAANGGAPHAAATMWIRRLQRIDGRAMAEESAPLSRWACTYDAWAGQTFTRATLAATLERAAQLSQTDVAAPQDVRVAGGDLPVATLLDEARRILLGGTLVDHQRFPEPTSAFAEALRRANGGSTGGMYSQALAAVIQGGCVDRCLSALHAAGHRVGDDVDAALIDPRVAARVLRPYAHAIEPVAVQAGARPLPDSTIDLF